MLADKWVVQKGVLKVGLRAERKVLRLVEMMADKLVGYLVVSMVYYLVAL